MPLQPEKLPTIPLSELVQELHKREDSLDHLMAKAEIIRRQTQAQLDACAAQERACASQERNARYTLSSAIAAAVSAFAAAVAVGISVYTFLNAIVGTWPWHRGMSANDPKRTSTRGANAPSIQNDSARPQGLAGHSAAG